MGVSTIVLLDLTVCVHYDTCMDGGRVCFEIVDHKNSYNTDDISRSTEKLCDVYSTQS